MSFPNKIVFGFHATIDEGNEDDYELAKARLELFIIQMEEHLGSKFIITQHFE